MTKSLPLSTLLKEVSDEPQELRFDPEIDVVSSDSRLAREGGIFVALPGQRLDGHNFIEAACMSGIEAVIYQKDRTLPESLLESIEIAAKEGRKFTQFTAVENTRIALSRLAAKLYGPLSERLDGMLFGITGTNGKTTCSYLMESVLQAAGGLPGILGTINYRVGEQIFPASLTTPPPELLWQTVSRLEEAGATHLVMEVSSHALDQYRVDGLSFGVSGFTNLTQDHLDYHKDFDDYLNAKSRLFSELTSSSGRCVINIDDPASEKLIPRANAPVWTYSREPGKGADFQVLKAEIGIKGITTTIQTPNGELHIKSSLLGGFNLSNILLVCGMAMAIGISNEAIEKGIANLHAVPGRMESVISKADFEVVVDYAHTPDALRNVLDTSRDLNEGRLIVLVGCGGDRDKEKRPQMGEVAAKKADIVIVTSDNPRTEDPQTIIDEILPGVTAHMEPIPVDKETSKPSELEKQDKGYWSCMDRAQAIEEAVMGARSGDLILIAGKGHEAVQIIGNVHYPFDDRVASARALNKREPGTVAEDLYQRKHLPAKLIHEKPREEAS